MFNIIASTHIEATIIAIVSGILIIEFYRRRQAKYNLMRNRHNIRKVVGIIDANEVNQELIKDENDIIIRKSNLSSMKETKHNDCNRMLKARSAYNNQLEQINSDRESLLY